MGDRRLPSHAELADPPGHHGIESSSTRSAGGGSSGWGSPSRSDQLHETWTIPGPGRPLFGDATANFTRNSPAEVNTRSAVRGPLLLGSGTLDHTVPRVGTLETLKLYAPNTASVTEYHEFEGRGHSLTSDHGWADVATDVLDWFSGKGLGAESRVAVDNAT